MYIFRFMDTFKMSLSAFFPFTFNKIFLLTILKSIARLECKNEWIIH